jgi:hypothetical protein
VMEPDRGVNQRFGSLRLWVRLDTVLDFSPSPRPNGERVGVRGFVNIGPRLFPPSRELTTIGEANNSIRRIHLVSGPESLNRDGLPAGAVTRFGFNPFISWQIKLRCLMLR